MSDRTCTGPQCTRPVLAKGLCGAHYQQRAAGKPLTPTIPRLPKTASTEDRFFAKVEQRGDCWVWIGALNAYGYGKFGESGRRTAGAHRWSYEFLRAEIPEGLHLDHLCRNRACVNPWHLEPVTALVNSQRVPLDARNRPEPWDVCGRGHPMVGDNVYVTPRRGNRCCRTCRLAAQTAWRQEHQAS